MPRVLFALCLLFSAVSQADYCLQDWACVQVESTPQGGYQFWVVNKKPYPFTATLVVRGTNLQDANGKQGRHTITQVLREKGRVLALSLDRQNPHRRSSYRDSFYWTPGDMHATHAPDTPYIKPFAPGQRFRMVQGFGGRYSHTGSSRYAVDFAMPVGTPIHAARGGIVIDTEQRHNRGGASRRYAKYANYVVVLHADGTTGEYYHLKQNGVVVQVGQSVAPGDLLGYSGNTGFSSLPHLHFAVYRAKPYGDFESLPFKFN